MKVLGRQLPMLPLSALLFYLSVFLLWKVGIIPSPLKIVDFLQGLYDSYGLAGLFIGSFLEGIVYFGLYFPGSFVVILAVILSGGSFGALLSISVVVASALWTASIVNYLLGVRISQEKGGEDIRLGKREPLSKGLIFSSLHPNALAFYFFNSGIQRKNPHHLLLVPLIMVPYGLLLAVVFYLLREPLRRALENPYIMISALLAWLMIAIAVSPRKKSTR